MGTGSYGGSGGGGSGAGGGGGSGGGAAGGTPQFGGGVMTYRPGSADEATDDVKKTLGGLPKEYIQKHFCSPAIRTVYEQLFRISVDLFQNKTWEGIVRRDAVRDGPGCLARWANSTIAKLRQDEPDRKVRDLAEACLNEFLMQALNNDLNLFVNGSSKEILSKIRQEIFNNAPREFLSLMLWHIIEREKERLPESRETLLKEAAEEKAGGVVGAFERKFHGKDQKTYRDLFRVACENMDWFLEVLRK